MKVVRKILYDKYPDEYKRIHIRFDSDQFVCGIKLSDEIQHWSGDKRSITVYLFFVTIYISYRKRQPNK